MRMYIYTCIDMSYIYMYIYKINFLPVKHRAGT